MNPLPPNTILRPLAWQRADQVQGTLHNCNLCGFRCGVNRLAGELGACNSPLEARVFHAKTTTSGEEDIVPAFEIRLAGCNLSCTHCVIGELAQNPLSGSTLNLESLSQNIQQLAPHLASVLISGGEPTVHLDSALRIAALVPPNLPIVWKTNAYAQPETLALLDGVIDIFLADYKFGNDTCAHSIANVPHYTQTVQNNLRWAYERGILMIRHLLMPGHYDCCTVPLLDWVARELPGVPFSLMDGYAPAWKATQDAQLNRFIRAEEATQALKIARQKGIALTSWKIAPESSVKTGPQMAPASDLWIDPTGRIVIGTADSELAACLKKIISEFG